VIFDANSDRVKNHFRQLAEFQNRPFSGASWQKILFLGYHSLEEFEAKRWLQKMFAGI